jgi:hypothetical protein
LLYNEFIVYDVEQLKLRFLVQVKFNFEKWTKKTNSKVFKSIQ